MLDSHAKPMPPQNCRQLSVTSRARRPAFSFAIDASVVTSPPCTYSSVARYVSARSASTSVQLGEPIVHDLVIEHRPPEDFARARVIDRLVDRAIEHDERGCRAVEPLLLELQHLVCEALAFFADQVAARHAYVVEEDLRGVR